jgi:hypothetical protein
MEIGILDGLKWTEEYYDNTYEYTAGLLSGQNIHHDTMKVEWLEVCKLPDIVKVQPQPNTTGVERKATLYLWGPPTRYNGTLLIIQPAE